MAPDEPDQTTPSVEPTPEPTPSPAVEVAPEQEPVVSVAGLSDDAAALSAEPVEAPAVAEPEQEPVVSAELVEAPAVAEPPPAEGEQQVTAN